MNRQSRDLIVFSKKLATDEAMLEHEIDQLHHLLVKTELPEAFCTANELIDLNKNRVISHPEKIRAFIFKEKNRPFVFIRNKN